MVVEGGGEVGSWGRPYQRFDLAKKVFRRRKKALQGDDINAELLARAETAKAQDKSGLLCRECGRRRKWSEIEFKYTPEARIIVRTWFCRVCGNQLREDEL